MAGEDPKGTEDPKEDPKAGDGAANGDPKGADPKPQGDPKGDKGSGGDGDVKDTHGQPGINKERHEKEMAAKDAKIAELEAKLDESAKTEKGREDLKSELEKVKAEMADERIAHKLELAGCRSVKAAKALLDDFDGDVDKLKADAPYLFEDVSKKKVGSTGKPPEGAAGKTVDDILDKSMKMKMKEE